MKRNVSVFAGRTPVRVVLSQVVEVFLVEPALGSCIRRPRLRHVGVHDGLEVGCKPTRQPHHLDVALRFTLELAARLHAIEIAVEGELEHCRGMIRRSPHRSRHHACESQGAKIELVDEGVDDANGIALFDAFFEACWNQCDLPALRASDSNLPMICLDRHVSVRRAVRRNN